MLADINIGIDKEKRQASSDLVNRILADEHIIYIATRNYHWNLNSPHFSELHAFFEEQYTELAVQIDEIAERIRMIGGTPAATLTQFLEMKRIDETVTLPKHSQGMVIDLLDKHEALIRSLRADIKTIENEYEDLGTADFLTALMGAHEKMAWMLRAHQDHANEPKDMPRHGYPNEVI